MFEETEDRHEPAAPEMDDRQLAQVSAGRTTQAGVDLLIWSDGDGSDVATRQPLEAAGLEVVVAASSL